MQNWHTTKMNSMKTKTICELEYIAKDCYEAALCAQDLGDAEAEGRYLDERHYALMELHKRRKAA